MKEVDIRAVLKALIQKKYKTQSKAARHWNVSPQFVSKMLAGDKPVPERIANDAGYRMISKEAMWVKIKKEK